MTNDLEREIEDVLEDYKNDILDGKFLSGKAYAIATIMKIIKGEGENTIPIKQSIAQANAILEGYISREDATKKAIEILDGYRISKEPLCELNSYITLFEAKLRTAFNIKEEKE